MRNYLSLVALLLLAVISSPSHAQTYYWYYGSLSAPIFTSSSPHSVCRYLNENNPTTGPTEKTGQYKVTVDGASALCQSERRYLSNGYIEWFNEGYIYRAGNSCPVSSNYNPLTGECDAPQPSPCETAVGIIYHQQKIADILSTGGYGNFTPTPDQVCQAGCGYGSPAADGHAFRFVSGDPAGAFQRYSYRGTGQACPAGVVDVTPPSQTKPTADKQSDCTNKVTDAEGRISFSCTVADRYTDPGNMDCGEVGGQFQCLAKNPAPKQTEKTVKTDVVEKPNADGSKDTQTTTTTTTTVCSGVGACSSTTTTSVSNSHTKSDGSKGAESSTCSGPGCTDSKGESQESREEEEKKEGTVTGGSTCDIPPVCTGDPLQCEIISQQYKTRCQSEELTKFDSTIKDQIEGIANGQGTDIKQTEVDLSSLFQQGTRFLPAACPQPEIASVNGAQALAFSYDPMCRLATGISPIVIIIASLGAALYMFRD